MKFKVIVCSDDNTEVDYSINLLSSEEAQAFIKGWQSLQNEAAQLAPDACPYCLGTGKGKMSGVEVGCNMCSRTGKIG